MRMLAATFTEAGPLGLRLTPNKQTGNVEVLQVIPGTQAERRHPELRPGLVFREVGEQSVAGIGYAPTLALIKTAGRPLTLRFVGGGTVHSTASPVTFAEARPPPTSACSAPGEMDADEGSAEPGGQGAGPETPQQLRPQMLLQDERYQQRTCGMQAGLLSRLRAALPQAESTEKLCASLLDALPAAVGDETVAAAVWVAPPFGPPQCFVRRGEGEPQLGVWLMPDPLDVDSKQTTFVRGDEATVASWMAALYRWDPELPRIPSAVQRRNSLDLGGAQRGS